MRSQNQTDLWGSQKDSLTRVSFITLKAAIEWGQTFSMSVFFPVVASFFKQITEIKYLIKYKTLITVYETYYNSCFECRLSESSMNLLLS